MRKEAAVFLAILMTGCAQVEKTPTFGPTQTPEPTPLTAPIPTIEPTQIQLDSQYLTDKASQNFLSLLNSFQNSTNPYINTLGTRLIELQTNNSQKLTLNTFSVSAPIFDPKGNFLPNTSLPMTCGFDNFGVFKFTLNTNTYYFDSLIPLEVSAVRLDECLNYENNIMEQYQTFKIDNPDISLTEALDQNPDWTDKAIIDAWYYTTKNIIMPNQDKMPKGKNIYQFCINFFNATHGDLEIWRENFLKEQPSDQQNT